MSRYVLQYWKPIFVLLIITPILTELLTNNIPARKLFKPATFFLFATLVYGPVLLLRELAVRWRLATAGYILLGLVYGIYNEGIVAKTIFQTVLPNPSFNNYGTAWGINFSWMVVIIVFHAFYAFLFPVLIVNLFFPSLASKPWINKRLWLFISAAFVIYSSWNFLKSMQTPITALHYLFLVILMLVLVLASRIFKNENIFKEIKKKVWLFCVYGVVFVIALFPLSDVIIRSGISSIVFIGYVIAVLGIVMLVLNKTSSVKSLLVFCLAAEIAFATCAFWVAKVVSSRTGMETSIFFIAIFLIVFVVVLRRKHLLPGPGLSV